MAKKKKKKPAKKTDIDKLVDDFAVEVMSNATKDHTPYYIPFMHKGLQYITGGVPGGKFTEISGDSQCGKSFLLYELMRSCQDMGGEALLEDPEIAFEPKFGDRVGLVKEFFYSRENQMEKSFALARKWIKASRKKKKSGPLLVGIDSYPALRPLNALKEMEKLEKADAKELKGYLAAKKNALFSELISDLIPFIDRYEVAFVMINQTRVKMNVMFGDPTTVNAENIVKFFATLRLQGRLSTSIKKEIKIGENKTKKKKIGVDSVWKTIKNRNIDPFKEAMTRIMYKSGIDPLSGFTDLMILEEKFVPITWSKKGEKKKISGFKYNDTRFTLKKVSQIIEKYPEIMIAE